MNKNLPPYYVRLRRLAWVTGLVAVLAVAFVIIALAYCDGLTECRVIL